MEHVVGMGEFIVSDREEDVIRTFALASCVAVTVYSPAKRAAGMIHIVLPSPPNTKEGCERPGYFAETGIPLLISEMCGRFGCTKEELDIRMYGGAESMLYHDIFHIGRQNIDKVKLILLNMGLTIKRADLRGSESRTLAMEVKTGCVEVFRQSMAILGGVCYAAE